MNQNHLTQARKCKNVLRKRAFGKNGTAEDRKAFRAAVRTVSYLRKQDKQKKCDKSRSHMEKRYRNNFYEFSKAACTGSLNESSTKPLFSEDVANNYFGGKYSTSNVINIGSLNWFPNVNINTP